MSASCVFCALIQNQHIIFESAHFGVVWDIAPMRDGHLLILSKTHRESLSELTADECDDLMKLQLTLLNTVKAVAEGFDVTFILNNGLLKDDGTHFHVHALPRLPHDGFWEGQPTSTHFPKEPFLKVLNSIKSEP